VSVRVICIRMPRRRIKKKFGVLEVKMLNFKTEYIAQIVLQNTFLNKMSK